MADIFFGIGMMCRSYGTQNSYECHRFYHNADPTDLTVKVDSIAFAMALWVYVVSISVDEGNPIP